MVFGSANTNYVLPENIEQHILDGYKLIDVREDDEWNAGHHSGAKHIPMSTIPKNLNSHQPLLEVLKTDLSKEFNTLKSNGDLQRGH